MDLLARRTGRTRRSADLGASFGWHIVTTAVGGAIVGAVGLIWALPSPWNALALAAATFALLGAAVRLVRWLLAPPAAMPGGAPQPATRAEKRSR